MFVEHMRREFYDLLYEERVLVLANHDVDSVCATKILLHLFRIDNIGYILVTVRGVTELKETFKDYVNQAKVVVLINCGGTVDILDLFGNPKDTIFFVMDNHRPLHILNVYNESKQVRIVSPPIEDEGIPAFDDIFRAESESEDESEGESEEEEGADQDEDQNQEEEEGHSGEEGPRAALKRKRTRRAFDRAAANRKRQEKQQWLDRRRVILHNYSQYSYFGAPASVVALELSWCLTRDQNEIVWWAIVGLTDFISMNRIDRSNYTLLVSQMQNHVARITNANTVPLDCLKIVFENEPNLYLYRQWNLYESMKISPGFACKFKTWTVKGMQRFHQYLAEIGLPLAQARQKFTSMDLDLRKGIKQVMARREEAYRLEEITVGSFIGTCGYRYKYSALDNHIATLALLEAPSDKSSADRFLLALQSLSKERYEIIESGIVEAKILVTAIYKQVQAFLELKQINCIGSIMFIVMQEGGPDSNFFMKPNSLTLLAHFALRAFVSHSTGRRYRHLPLIVISPPNDGTCMAIGLPPVTMDVSSNLFGKAFEQLKKRHPLGLDLDCFETNICRVKSNEKDKFIENLLALLAC